jgi:hypothetical protein
MQQRLDMPNWLAAQGDDDVALIDAGRGDRAFWVHAHHYCAGVGARERDRVRPEPGIAALNAAIARKPRQSTRSD